jgi:hypothetical protein
MRAGHAVMCAEAALTIHGDVLIVNADPRCRRDLEPLFTLGGPARR